MVTSEEFNQKAVLAVVLGLLLSIPPIWTDYIGFNPGGIWLDVFEQYVWDEKAEDYGGGFYQAYLLFLPTLSAIGLIFLLIDSKGVAGAIYVVYALLGIYLVAVASAVASIVKYVYLYGDPLDTLQYEGPALIGLIPSVMLMLSLKTGPEKSRMLGQQSLTEGTTETDSTLQIADRDMQASLHISDKQWLPTVLLCFFLGGLGVHRFYVGKVGTGVAQIFTLGGLGIWVLVDFIMICIGSFKDKQERYIKSGNDSSVKQPSQEKALSKSDEIEKLFSLKERGIISDEEFEEQKRSVLKD